MEMKNSLQKIIKPMLMLMSISYALSPQVYAQSWVLTEQSYLGFDIKSLGVTIVRAKFNRMQSQMQFDPQKPEQASAQFVMDVNSLSLNKPVLKNMILGQDFFYASKYKTAQFKSTHFKNLGRGQYQITGNLTLRGVTKPVHFITTLKPNSHRPDWLDVYSSAVIDRSDFGMKKAVAGIGEKVNIQLTGQWIPQ